MLKIKLNTLYGRQENKDHCDICGVINDINYKLNELREIKLCNKKIKNYEFIE